MATPPGPGQQPTPQQIAAMQAQISEEAAKRGMTPQQFQLWQRQQMEADAKKAGLSFDEYINRLKQHALETHQRKLQLAQQQQAAEQSGQPQIQQGKSEQQVPITPGAPDPKALALAKWMRGQDLKTRTCILNGQRKDMFRGLSAPLPISFARNPQATTTLEIKPQISQASPPRPSITRLRRRRLKKELPPPPRHTGATYPGNIQTSPPLSPRSSCLKSRPSRGS